MLLLESVAAAAGICCCCCWDLFLLLLDGGSSMAGAGSGSTMLESGDARWCWLWLDDAGIWRCSLLLAAGGENSETSAR